MKNNKLLVISFFIVFILLLSSCKKDKIDFDEDYVSSVEVFDEDGGRSDWNVVTNKIVYDRQVNGRWDTYICDADKSNLLNLTSDMTGQTYGDQTIQSWQYRGQPAFSKNGNYILFQVQNEHASEDPVAEEHLSLGINNDLFFMTADGSIKLKLTNNPAGYSVLHPHFSHDLTKILWAERYDANEDASMFGRWRMKVADVNISNDSLSITNITDLQPCGVKWYETHAFSADDSKIYFSCNYETDFKASDLFEYNLNTGALTKLSNSASEWEEMYNINPANTNQYSFISSRFFEWDNEYGWGTLRTELYIMDGSEARQLTYYNQLKKNNQKRLTTKHQFIGDHCWSPDGKSILAILASAKIGGTATSLLKINLN